MESSDRFLELQDVIRDLNTIFHQAMADKELAVALKSREVLLKILSTEVFKKRQEVKPLLEWTNEEIQSFISDAERLHRQSGDSFKTDESLQFKS
ncbi:hypothetical protein HE1_00044 [Holospora elegans E1]|uniref:Uncharacterized protein n=1 Tax=Holospora elegans E1 TaxID=1427503 RepID=A0A023DXS5_9PROT|nr:hypothetical protein [Holospora elegans]GAJ45735.1 hypothetical protein HE1_00044 [Holospora elegans E1]